MLVKPIRYVLEVVESLAPLVIALYQAGATLITMLYYNEDDLKRKLDSTLLVMNVECANLRDCVIDSSEARVEFFMRLVEHMVHKLDGEFRIGVIAL